VAKFWGTDTKPMCVKLKKAIGLFATFKPETPFSKMGLKELKQQKTVNKSNFSIFEAFHEIYL
jgi:hypothetical protein